MGVGKLCHRRNPALADVFAVLALGMERTPRRQIRGIRHQPGDGFQLLAAVVNIGQGPE